MDWSAPVEELRTELRHVCESSELWDGRVCVLQVTEAIGGMVRLRALVSAADAGALWDLRCVVRERLVGWVWEHRQGAMPRLRADTDPPKPSLIVTTLNGHPGEDGQIFAGSTDGEARGAAFVGPDEPARH